MTINIDLTAFTANADGSKSSLYPLGDKPQPSDPTVPPIPNDAIWVATDGNDSTGNGSNGNPYLTISHATAQMTTGQTVVVKDGVYNDRPNWINDYLHTIPAGTSQAPTVIRAENMFGVELRGDGGLLYPDSQIRLDGDYIDVFGFFCNMLNDATPPTQVAINGNFNRVMKCIARREGQQDSYGGWFRFGGNATYNLVEDCAGVGACRYGFGAGGTSGAGHHNIYRRCVGRFDYTESNQPKATFNHYGANGGYTSHHHVFQNCISLDGNEVDYHGGSSGFKYGGFTSIKTASDDMYQGCLVLNEQVDISAIWLDGRDHTLRDIIVWDIQDMPTYGQITPDGVWDRSSMEPITEASNFTIGQVAGNDIGGDSGNLSPTNSNLSPVGLQHLPQRNTGVTIGAEMLKKVGVSGTRYGETGWDQVTDDDLWPWPYEDKIKEIFSMPNPVPANYSPVTNDTLRGFCAAGNDAWGQPNTLTRYVWQYLGNQIPASIYGGA